MLVQGQLSSTTVNGFHSSKCVRQDELLLFFFKWHLRAATFLSASTIDKLNLTITKFWYHLFHCPQLKFGCWPWASSTPHLPAPWITTRPLPLSLFCHVCKTLKNVKVALSVLKIRTTETRVALLVGLHWKTTSPRTEEDKASWSTKLPSSQFGRTEFQFNWSLCPAKSFKFFQGRS